MKRLPLRNLVSVLIGLGTVSLLAPCASAQSPAFATKAMQASPVATGPAYRGFNNLQTAEAANIFRQPQRLVAKPFLPVLNNQALDQETYHALKKAARTGRPSRDGSTADPMGAILPMTAASAGQVHINGFDATQTGGWSPPDGGFSVGPNHLIQLANNNIQIYNKTLASATVAYTGTSMNDFFGYNAAHGFSNAQPCFDPRVLYDKTTGHWFLISDTFAESSSVQYFCIAASVDSNPLDGFYTYLFNVNPFVASNQSSSSAFFDFPNIGQDSQNLIITANVFSNNFGATLFLFNKAGLISGSLGGWYFAGLNGTLTPPDVDSPGSAGYSYLIFPQPYSSNIGVYALSYSGSTPQLTGYYNIGVPYYAYPPAASQPGTNATLDTSDTRFAAQSVQIGDNLYNVHCVGVNGHAIVRMYNMNGFTGTLTETEDMHGRPTSDDFNPSISADFAGSWAVNWDSVNAGARVATSNYQTQVRYTSKQLSDLWSGTLAAGKVVSGSKSATSYLLGRTGDYSGMVRDPVNQRYFWGLQWDIMDSYDWITKIYNIHFSVP